MLIGSGRISLLIQNQPANIEYDNKINERKYKIMCNIGDASFKRKPIMKNHIATVDDGKKCSNNEKNIS